MKRVLLLCFLVLGVGVGAASGGLAVELPQAFPALRPSPAVDHYRLICKSKVQITGILDARNMPGERRPFPQTYVDFVMTGLDGAIAVDGKLYPLDLGASASLRDRARRMTGKRVILQGNTERRALPLSPHLEASASPEALRYVEYVLVASIEEADESIRETIEVDAQGRLEVDALLGLDGTTGPVLRVEGATYVLDFSGCGMPLSFARWDGRTVHIKATLGEWRTFVGPMAPKGKAPRYRVLHVEQIRLVEDSYIKQNETVEIGGPLKFYRHIRFGRGAVAITVAGKAYWLDFGSDRLHALAQKLTMDGLRVRIVGALRASDGAIEVARVEALDEIEHYRETSSVEIRGILQEALRLYPASTIRERTLLVNVHGRELTLRFADNFRLYTVACEMVGERVVIRGRLTDTGVVVTEVRPAAPEMLRIPCIATLS